VSNRTVLVERSSGEAGPSGPPGHLPPLGGVSPSGPAGHLPPPGGAWVLKQALAKLRVQVDWFSPPERVHREALGLRWLAQLAPAGAITAFVFEDFQHHILAMGAVPKPHQNWKALLLAGQIESDHIAQFARLLGSIHRVSNARLTEVEPLFGDRGYFESLRLEPYYAYTATQVDAATDFLTTLIAETRSHRDTIVHGDYSPKNVLVHEGRLVLLDHEVIHVGDPGFDLGFSMTHFLSKAHHIPAKRSQFAAATADYWRIYKEEAGDALWTRDLEARAVRHTLGCLLARVAGRSPLEYLDAEERDQQRNAVVRLMATPPATIDGLIEGFLGNL
jgi:5-methylthioribose kinase